MPVSRRRKKNSTPVVATPAGAGAKRAAPPPSPPWYGGLILAMFIIGIVWLLCYYLSEGNMPGISALGGWNLLVGFGFVVVGLGLATRWR